VIYLKENTDRTYYSN